MQLIDCSAMVGRYNRFKENSFHEPEELIWVMDRYGIAQAVVHHALAMEHHPLDGNQATLRVCQEFDRFIPAFSYLPNSAQEFPPPEDFLDQCEESGVRIIRLFPMIYQFPLDDWCMGDLLSAMQARRFPLILDCRGGEYWNVDAIIWPPIVDLCQRYPNLPVVFSHVRIRNTRVIYAALDTCPNLALDLSAMWLYRPIEGIVSRFGAHRVLFGTGLPVRDPACAIGTLLYAEAASDVKEAVAGGNLLRLLERK